MCFTSFSLFAYLGTVLLICEIFLERERPAVRAVVAVRARYHFGHWLQGTTDAD